MLTAEYVNVSVASIFCWQESLSLIDTPYIVALITIHNFVSNGFVFDCAEMNILKILVKIINYKTRICARKWQIMYCTEDGMIRGMALLGSHWHILAYLGTFLLLYHNDSIADCQ